jgi:hypothetical protein
MCYVVQYYLENVFMFVIASKNLSRKIRAYVYDLSITENFSHAYRQ